MPSMVQIKSKGLVNNSLFMFSKLYKESLNSIPCKEDKELFHKQVFEYMLDEVNQMKHSFKFIP